MGARFANHQIVNAVIIDIKCAKSDSRTGLRSKISTSKSKTIAAIQHANINTGMRWNQASRTKNNIGGAGLRSRTVKAVGRTNKNVVKTIVIYVSGTCDS